MLPENEILWSLTVPTMRAQCRAGQCRRCSNKREELRHEKKHLRDISWFSEATAAPAADCKWSGAFYWRTISSIVAIKRFGRWAELGDSNKNHNLKLLKHAGDTFAQTSPVATL